MRSSPTSTSRSPNGSAPFVDAALAANLEEPSTRASILWAGARAIGLHRWHPEVQKLNVLQLQWAILQATPGKREQIRAGRSNIISERAAAVVEWFDNLTGVE